MSVLSRVLLKYHTCAAMGAAALLLFAPARAQVPNSPANTAAPGAAAALAVAGPSAFACSAPAELSQLNYPLRHSARRLANGEPLTIVAIGSSSTTGVGASSPAMSYPSRLAVELKRRFPGREITVLNRGVNGQETHEMVARFATDVIAAHPDLVLWQVGTNSVLRDHPLRPHSVLLRDGIAQLKEAGTDVVLIDMQFVPRVIAKPETQGMEDQIALSAKEQSVDLFRRFALMRNWHEVQHIPFETFVSPDELHMNDWSYACVAKLLAAAIAEAATRPIASAAARFGR
ncbi:MAG TPA: SGNH/GDSL hydrolase family protein [Xanthobacteraceae bacterium]|jgi:acyl-CoA thioesterase-1|nr:SGNH/GDSL hydrolase family protein [Xanthobacteraceae bacterium]